MLEQPGDAAILLDEENLSKLSLNRDAENGVHTANGTCHRKHREIDNREVVWQLTKTHKDIVKTKRFQWQTHLSISFEKSGSFDL